MNVYMKKNSSVLIKFMIHRSISTDQNLIAIDPRDTVKLLSTPTKK